MIMRAFSFVPQRKYCIKNWTLTYHFPQDSGLVSDLEDVFLCNCMDVETWMQEAEQHFSTTGYPWAILVLPTDLPIAGHIAKSRKKYRYAPMSCYANGGGFAGEPFDLEYVGLITIPEKGTLQCLSKHSAFFRHIWQTAKALPANMNHFLFCDFLPLNLLKDISRNNRSLFVEMRYREKIANGVEVVIPKRYQSLEEAWDYADHRQDWAGVSKALKRLVRSVPEYADAWESLGRTFMELEDYESAISYAKEGLYLHPHNQELRTIMAESSANILAYEQSFEHAAFALDADPFNESLLKLQVKNCRYTNRLKGLVKCLEVLQDLYAVDASCWQHAGACFSKNARYSECRDCFEMAVRLGIDDDGYSMSQYGLCEAMIGSASKGVLACEAAMLSHRENEQYRKNYEFAVLQLKNEVRGESGGQSGM